MTEYISRESALINCPNVAYEAIKAIPSADVVEVKYAKDIYMQGKGHCEFKCSLCGAEIGCVEGGDMDGGKFNYCPNCGAIIEADIPTQSNAHPMCFQRISNADRIRAMTDEELLNLLCLKHCPTSIDPTFKCKDIGNCKPCWEEWLKQEESDGKD